MKKLTKQEQKDEALEAYEAIAGSAYDAYQAKCREIDERADDIKIIDGKKYKLVEELYENNNHERPKAIQTRRRRNT